jgi:hypothetical protein
MAISDVVPRCQIVVGNGKLGALNKPIATRGDKFVIVHET